VQTIPNETAAVTVFYNSYTTNSAAPKTSFEEALCIVKAKIPHTTAEKLILQSAVDMLKTILGVHIASEVHVIPLSNDTISHQISVMPNDMNE
jgi:hypothetical protein